MSSWGNPSPDRGTSGAMTYMTLVAQSLDELEKIDLMGSFTTLDEPTEAFEPEPIRTVVPERIGSRYQRRELLGKGGMGEVWRVYDTELHRTVALKVLHTPRNERTWQRFEEEARIAAQLQHPGIIPVYDVGRLDDGRLWFTMKEVRGDTLEELIVRTHKDWRMGREGSWTFRRLLEGFHRICETMAYAHARGVVHRDIKPSNLMFGEFGEILVLDWGLAKVLQEAVAEELQDQAVNSSLEADLTAVGVISGTPNYMSPEQAQGRSAEAGAASDVFSLGATLYDLLAERPPRIAKNVKRLIMQVAMGRPAIPPPSTHETGAPRDEALDAIVMKALHVDEDERYANAGELANELARWLDGALKRERAMKIVVEARADMAQSETLTREAEELALQAEAERATLAKYAPIEARQEAWRLEDESRQKRQTSAELRNRAIQGFRSALTHAPDLPEAHGELAAEFVRRHKQLEADGQELEARLLASDIALHDRAGTFTHYLKGTGAVTIVTDRPVEVLVHRYVEQDRRLVPVFEQSLGLTPLIEAPLEMGSYLLNLRAHDGVEVRYPVWIRRNEHWDGVGPGESEPSVIVVPPPGVLAEDDCYVPQSWCWIGDDVHAANLDLERVWNDAFVIKKHPVTVGAYAAWLNALLDSGRLADAEAAAPVFPGDDHVHFLEMRDGRYTGLPGDYDFLPGWFRDRDLPITVVSHTQAMIYATAKGWTLPTEAQTQHAARGADRRLYPWGDAFVPSFTHLDDTRGPTVVTALPLDVGPSGMAGHAGNVMTWVRGESGRDVAVGGRTTNGPIGCLIARRFVLRDGWREPYVSFRLAIAARDLFSPPG